MHLPVNSVDIRTSFKLLQEGRVEGGELILGWRKRVAGGQGANHSRQRVKGYIKESYWGESPVGKGGI